jgi:hypothetical protein
MACKKGNKQMHCPNCGKSAYQGTTCLECYWDVTSRAFVRIEVPMRALQELPDNIRQKLVQAHKDETKNRARTRIQ